MPSNTAPHCISVKRGAVSRELTPELENVAATSLPMKAFSTPPFLSPQGNSFIHFTQVNKTFGAVKPFDLQ